MQQTSLAIVEDTPEVLKARLKREWEVIEERKQSGEVDYDVKRAQALTAYMGLGLNYKEIAEATGSNRGRTDQLLRYGRFANFASTNVDATISHISEGRFRRYWKETVDKSAMAILRGNGRKEDNKSRIEYEQQVFKEISEKLMKGEAPKEPSWKPKKTVMDIKPAQLKELRADIKSYQALKQKEVKAAYTKIEEDVRALIELSGCSRSTYAPNILAMHAKRLKVGFADLQRALKGKVDQWVVDILE